MDPKKSSASGKGWYDAIGDPVLQILQVIADGLFDNFGLAIIVFTIFTRLVLLPLTIKQYRGMKEMQRKMKDLKPKMDALKKKYKDDSKKMMSEQMKLYKEAGITPWGCLTGPMGLTMLIQMPIFIAMIAAVRVGANPVDPQFPEGPSIVQDMGMNSGFLWLDMTQPDPLLILPIVVAITMFFSQRMTSDVTSDEPTAQMMKKMMNIMMPLFFFWICWINPSGLALYWFVSMGIQVGVQYYIKREGEPSPVLDGATAKKALEPSGQTSKDGSRTDTGEALADVGDSEGGQGASKTTQKPEQHRADITTDKQTSDRKEHIRHGKSRSKRKNRRRGR